MTSQFTGTIPALLSYTFGDSHAGPHETATQDWPTMAADLAAHQVGPKAGECFIPAVFAPVNGQIIRKQEHFASMHALMIDFDHGTLGTQIKAALIRAGVGAVVTTTHSHMTDLTDVAKATWDKWLVANPNGTPERFLIQVKHLLPHVAAGAELVGFEDHGREGKPKLRAVFKHQPCPKHRAIIPFARPWLCPEGATPEQAAAAWAALYAAMVRSLGFEGLCDLSIDGTQALVYFPRHNEGAPWSSDIIEGLALDPYAFAPAASVTTTSASTTPAGGKTMEQIVADMNRPHIMSGDFDLTAWAAKHRKRFLLMTAMQCHCPEKIIGDAKPGTNGRSDKWPIECPNADAHTHEHYEGDRSTMAWDACEAQGFGFKCLHNCEGSEHDDLIYLKMLIENDHLPLAALTDKRFLLGEPEPAPNARLVLSVGSPMESAKEMLRRDFTIDGAPTLVRQHGDFYHWDGRRYAPVKPESMAARVSRFLAGARCVDAKGNEGPFHPTQTKVNEVVAALVNLTQLPDGAEAPCWLDGRTGPSPKHLVACSNGLLDMSTRELLEHTPAYFSLNALDFAFDANAASSAWLKFVREIWPDDPQSIDTLQEFIGLLLTGDMCFQKALMILGPPRSGKGTIDKVITNLLGAANVCNPTLDDFGRDFGLASLIGKRAAIISDALIGSSKDLKTIAGRIQAITGQDAITINRKYRDHWTGRLETRVVIMTNELPKIDNASGALVSRLVMLKLTRSFLGKEDLGLSDRLLKELPGILNWAIEGLHRLRQRGHFIQPQSALGEVEEMEHLGSPVKQFADDTCDLDPGFSEPVAATYARYLVWCEQQGLIAKPLTLFGRELKAAVPALTGGKRGPAGAQTRHYVGIRAARTATSAVAHDDTVVPFTPRNVTHTGPKDVAPPTRRELRRQRFAALGISP